LRAKDRPSPVQPAGQHGHCLVAEVAISIDPSLLHTDANLDANAGHTTLRIDSGEGTARVGF
jgi:hypothetical protein